jgi:hypothetical protein
MVVTEMALISVDDHGEVSVLDLYERMRRWPLSGQRR